MRAACLGPEGSFTHRAALTLADGAELILLESVEAVLAALVSGHVEIAVAAIDSAAGPVVPVQAFVEQGRAQITGRLALAVSFNLYRSPGDDAPLAGVFGHEKALAQIAGFLSAHRLRGEAMASNTAGLARLRDDPRPGWGAAGPPGLESVYRLVVTHTQLEGPHANETHFVRLRRPGAGTARN
jgi:prephenate dehydratase